MLNIGDWEGGDGEGSNGQLKDLTNIFVRNVSWQELSRPEQVCYSSPFPQGTFLYWVPCSHSFNQQTFITHQVLSMNRKRYQKSKSGTSALVISKQESGPFRDLLPLIFFHVSQTKPTQKLQHPPSGRSCTIAPNCASLVKDTHK